MVRLRMNQCRGIVVFGSHENSRIVLKLYHGALSLTATASPIGDILKQRVHYSIVYASDMVLTP